MRIFVRVWASWRGRCEYKHTCKPANQLTFVSVSDSASSTASNSRGEEDSARESASTSAPASLFPSIFGRSGAVVAGLSPLLYGRELLGRDTCCVGDGGKE